MGGADAPAGTSDTFIGDEGDDSISAGGSLGDDQLYGGAGNDTLSGANASLYGEAGNDVLQGGLGDGHHALGNDLYGGAGDDTLLGGGQLDGGDGNDWLESSIFNTAVGGAELVIVAADIFGSLSLDAAAAAIGSADQAYGAGQSAVFVVDNGQDSWLLYFQSSGTDAVVSAAELSIAGRLDGCAGIQVGDVAWGP